MELENWKESAIKEQNGFKTIYNRNLEFKFPDTLDEMKTIIGFGLFGLPKLNDDVVSTHNCHTCYKDDQKKIINLITDVIASEYDNFYKSLTDYEKQDNYYFKNRIVCLTNIYLICKFEKKLPKSEDKETVSNENEDGKNISNEKQNDRNCENEKKVPNEKQNDKDSKDKNEISSDYIGTICIYAFSFDNEHFKFIDFEARMYKDWQDFTDNNLLPPCEYCFPKEGIYKSNSEILFMHSSRSTIMHKVINYTDMGSSAAALASAAATLIVTSPLITPVALGVGIAAGTYGIARSVSQLIDRSQHKQSISIIDEESRNHWFTIAAASLTAGTGTILAKSTSLIGKFGTPAINGIKILNGITVCVDVAIFGNGMYSFYKKYKSGESFTYGDYLNICLQFMFLTGAIVNARQLHREMSQSGNANVNKTLTKSQKRNVRRKQAKARAKAKQDPNGVTGGKGNGSINVSVEQISTQNNILFGQLLQRCPQAVFHVLRQVYKPAALIVGHFESIKNNFVEYQNGHLDINTFLTRTYQHICNLHTILKEELEKLKSLISVIIKSEWLNSKLFQTEKEKDDICINLDNAVTKINNLEADINENNGTIKVPPGCVEKANCYEIIDQIENSVKRKLSQMVYTLSENIYAICLADGINLINSDVTEIYKYVMIDVLDLIVLNLSSDGSQIDKNKELFGDEIAAILKSNKENIIFNNTVQEIITDLSDLLYTNISRVISLGAKCYNPNVIQPDILHSTLMKLCDVLINTLNLYVKTNNTPFSYKHELILLKELLTEVEKIEPALHSENLTVSIKLPVLSEVLHRLQNDVKFDNEYYSAYTVKTDDFSVSITQKPNMDNLCSVDQELPKHKLIFILSHKLFMKLMESGFEMNQKNTTQIFDIVINFIKNKFIREIEDAYEKISVITNKENIFYIITDKLIKKCLSDDLLLAECIYFCMEQLVFVEDTSVWEDIIKEEGMEAYWYCDMTHVNDDKVVQKLEKKFNVMLCIMDNLKDDMLILKPIEGYSGNLKIIILCKVSNKGGCFVICYKNTDHEASVEGVEITDDEDKE